MAHVLVVDDEEPVRRMLHQVLEREGHEVSEAKNGDEALASYRRRRADLVITDILMPRKGGLVFLGELRKEFPGAKVLVISGGGKEGKLNFLATARTYPGVKTLRKPFERREFLAAVRGLLESQPA